MKKTLQIFLLLLFTVSLFGQIGENDICEPQPDLPLENALIYPLPFTDDPENPFDLGINKQAVIGQEFDFTWTMIWPDSFLNPVTFQIAYADTITFFLDQTFFVKGEDTIGIPEGLSLSMFPESGSALPSTEGPVACIRMSGTPTANVEPGDYRMHFVVNTCLTIPGVFDGCMDAIIPSILAGFPGTYVLTIKPEGTTSVKEILNDVVNLSISPNPFSDRTVIEYNSAALTGDYLFELFDLSGRAIQSSRINTKSAIQKIVIDSDNLSDGVYIFQLRGEDGIITDKLIIQR